MKIFFAFALILAATESPSGWVIRDNISAEDKLIDNLYRIQVKRNREYLFSGTLKDRHLKDGYFYLGNCEKNGIVRTDLIAYATYHYDQPFAVKIYTVWKIDIARKKILMVSPRVVRCPNESFGLHLK